MFFLSLLLCQSSSDDGLNNIPIHPILKTFLVLCAVYWYITERLEIQTQAFETQCVISWQQPLHASTSSIGGDDTPQLARAAFKTNGRGDIRCVKHKWSQVGWGSTSACHVQGGCRHNRYGHCRNITDQFHGLCWNLPSLQHLLLPYLWHINWGTFPPTGFLDCWDSIWD